MSRNIIKTALVTGAAKRLGAEIAIALAADGWNIALHYNSTKPDSVLEKIRKHGVKAEAIKADLNDFRQLRNIVPQATENLGEITLLINNASIFEKVSFAETDEDVYGRHMDIHVKAPFFLTQDFASQCTGRGQVINIVDSFTSKNKSSYFAYLVSKKSLRSLSKMLSLQLGPNILVNAVLPGAVEEFSENLDQAFLQRRISEIPTQKLATAKQITDGILYLANNNLTGQELFIDGGEQLI